MSSRSRRLFSYSPRVRRRRPVRTSPTSFACSAATIIVRSEARAFSLSAASGRAFFAGGISPDSIRSWTFTQRAKLSAFERSGFNDDRSRSPRFDSASWHPSQCFLKNSAGSWANPGPASARMATIDGKNRRIMRLVLLGAIGGKLRPAMVGFRPEGPVLSARAAGLGSAIVQTPGPEGAVHRRG